MSAEPVRGRIIYVGDSDISVIMDEPERAVGAFGRAVVVPEEVWDRLHACVLEDDWQAALGLDHPGFHAFKTALGEPTGSGLCVTCGLPFTSPHIVGSYPIQDAPTMKPLDEMMAPTKAEFHELQAFVHSQDDPQRELRMWAVEQAVALAGNDWQMGLPETADRLIAYVEGKTT